MAYALLPAPDNFTVRQWNDITSPTEQIIDLCQRLRLLHVYPTELCRRQHNNWQLGHVQNRSTSANGVAVHVSPLIIYAMVLFFAVENKYLETFVHINSFISWLLAAKNSAPTFLPPHYHLFIG